MRNQSKNKRGRISAKDKWEIYQECEKTGVKIGVVGPKSLSYEWGGEKPGRGLDHVPHDEDISKKSEMQQIVLKSVIAYSKRPER